MHGLELLETIRSLPLEGSSAIFLRHAERFPIVDAADPTLAEITPAGAAAAEAFGAGITGFDCVRLFHSPIKRCRQTAECIARGLESTGCSVEIAGAERTLGVDYILDLKEAGRLTLLHGNHFVRLWFTGQIAPTVIRPVAHIAAGKLVYLTQRLQEPCARGRRLDVHVSHDWNVIILRELMLHVRHEEAGWLTYLDGLAFSSRAAGLHAFYRTSSLMKSMPWTFDVPV
jgi:hypothetical protein